MIRDLERSFFVSCVLLEAQSRHECSGVPWVSLADLIFNWSVTATMGAMDYSPEVF
jgi:hypothetical protein